MNQELRDLLDGKGESKISYSELLSWREQVNLQRRQDKLSRDLFETELKLIYNPVVNLLSVGRLHSLGMYFMPDELTTVHVYKHRSIKPLTSFCHLPVSGRIKCDRPHRTNNRPHP